MNKNEDPKLDAHVEESAQVNLVITDATNSDYSGLNSDEEANSVKDKDLKYDGAKAVVAPDLSKLSLIEKRKLF